MSRQPTKNWGIGLSIARKGFILVWLPMCAQLVALAFSGYWLVKEFNDIESHHRKRFLQENVSIIRVAALQLAFALPQYAAGKQTHFAEEVAASVRQLGEANAALQRDVSIPESARPAALQISRHTTELLDSALVCRRAIDSAAPAVDGGKATAARNLTNISQLTANLEEEIKALQERLQSANNASPEDPAVLKKTALHILLLIGAMTGANIMLAMLMGTWFSEGITSRVKLMIENTFRLSRSQALHPRLPGNDEIAHLDRVFHDMANAIAEAARKERAVIKHAADVICSIGADGRFTAVSPASLQVWGYAPEELIGRQFTDIVIEEERVSTNESFRSLALAETDPQPIENRVMRKDGAVIYILWSVYWAPSEQSLFCVAHDITDRKLTEDQLRVSEARTRSIFESAPVALLVLDEKGLVNLINPKAEQMFACPGEDLIGKHISTLLPKSKDLCPVNFASGGCGSIFGRVTPLEAHSLAGRSFPVELTLEQYATSDGDGYLAAILDVTERREVERLKRDFVSTVSHELRTPLTSIRGSLTLLSVGALGKLTDQADKVVKIAERNSLRLISLINDLLDIEKMEAGKLELVVEEAPFNQVLERAVDAVRGFGEQYGVTIRHDTCDDYVFADCDRIVQVLVNLLSNAIKYSPRGAVVSIVVVKTGEGQLHVAVIDQGRGIPPEFCDRVFERFQQVEPDDAKRRGGTGLGLAICRAIVEQHNGSIGVQSEIGKGSTFWFEIPVAGTPAALALLKPVSGLVLPAVAAESGGVTNTADAVAKSPSGNCRSLLEDKSAVIISRESSKIADDRV